MQTGNGVVLLLVILSYLTGFGQSIFIKENDFKVFLNTTQPIWTFNTTNKYNKNYCIVDVTKKLLGETVMYTHSFYVDPTRKQRVSVHMEGALKYSNKMVATQKGSKVTFKHKLVYLDFDNMCAVVKVTPKLPIPGQPWHDLRMWNSSLVRHRHPSITCLHYFNLEAKHGRLTYKPICQKLLYQVNPYQKKILQGQKTPQTYRSTSV
ncbi:uncharacterized protein LOC119167324 [Rhipicephalus microplus]|uniref:uncharacterized protein LOC119167324 n=1 Tax=Rhipicephalus microplus TaxID=6941 RepID=UPI001888E640|nr:uncharacterized protein LOC119167324 [Rhipicephalus microplus]